MADDKKIIKSLKPQDIKSGPMISGGAPVNTYVGAQGHEAQPVVHPTTNVGYTPQYGGVTMGQPVQHPYPTGPNSGYPTSAPPSVPSAPYPLQSHPLDTKEPQAGDPMLQPPPAYNDVMQKE